MSPLIFSFSRKTSDFLQFGNGAFINYVTGISASDLIPKYYALAFIIKLQNAWLCCTQRFLKPNLFTNSIFIQPFPIYIFCLKKEKSSKTEDFRKSGKRSGRRGTTFFSHFFPVLKFYPKSTQNRFGNNLHTSIVIANHHRPLERALKDYW